MCSDSESIEKCADDRFDYHIKSVAWNLERTGGVALHQCNTMVYWTDLGRSTISVMKVGKNNLDEVTRGVSKDILTAEDGLEEPLSIAVDSCAGYIFFTDVGPFDVQVARAETDGSRVKTLATRTPDRSALRSPQALALDRLKQIVFFGDKHRQEIYKMDYNGNNYMKITRARAGQINDMALGCKGLGLVYTVATRNDPAYLHVGDSEPHKMNFSVVYKSYYGVCSYCDHCQCQSLSPCSLQNGGCSHLCFTSPSGERRCDCPLAYRLDDQDNTQCKVATDHLLVANVKNLLWIEAMQNSSLFGTDSKVLPIGHLRSMVALDYVKRSGHSYIVYTNNFAVQRSRLDGSETLTIVGGLPDAKGIAADCATGNIYYTDLAKPLIAVSNFDGTLQTVCFSSPTVSKPFSLALNIKIGTFYFSDIDRSAIYEASMDCTGSPKVLVSVYMAAGLTLDESAQLLYWAEFAQATIHYVDLKTKLQSEISVSFSYIRRPFDMTLLGNYLYVTDWVSHCVSRVHKTSGSVQGVSCNHNPRLNGIAHLQKTCTKASGVCSTCRHPQMCMLSSGSSSYVCVCPSGLITSGSSCILPSETFLLAASMKSIIAIPVRESASWTARLPLPPQTNLVAIDYDYKGKRVFWTNVDAKNIQSANLDGSNVTTVLSHDRHRDVCRLCVPDGLVYDSTNDRLYYTDYRANEICYVTPDGEVHRVVDGLDGPRSLIVRPDQNKLYFTEWGNNATISSLDISSRVSEHATPKVLLSTGISWPNALAMSKDGKTLYFGDAKEDYVASFDLQSQRVTYITNSTHIYALDVYDDYIYWTDWDSGVHKIPVKGGTVIQLATRSDVHRASGIRVFRPKE
ncbi:low-density lipoprotein receptor-related protein 4-like isoform X2 [Corticium candelabrum]|uniref:low-density lipoprotein receptor-related protein 4-like isoform X2 n=1 Tax=Corticium candelabrum TaxID=121492 RepID=UPI002E2543A1|nr:low-density lipoprotein receptor-related protein 4-like isoform X2 [Corticium candelabrum]